MVVACGNTWHKGHFFCAECGDPFDEKSRFVEKDGYAWCTGCYGKRYSGRCKGCRKPVMETVVRALGGEWCVGCFVCTVSTRGPLSLSPNVMGGQFEWVGIYADGCIGV